MPRLLIVDDDLGVCDILKDYFATKKGYDVQISIGGKEALRRIKKEPPHIVLLDIKMQDLDGIKVLRAIKKMDRRIGVIMLTAVSEEFVTKMAQEYGADGYITKPFKLDYLDKELQGLIVNILERTGALKDEKGISD